jgi:hypothetical protein
VTRGAISGSSICSWRLTVSAGNSAVRTVLDHLVRPIADDPAVAFMARLGAARFGLIPAFFAIRRGRLGGGARGLRWPLQPQHQLDQLFLAQTLKIAAAHDTRESAKLSSRKGLGNYVDPLS